MSKRNVQSNIANSNNVPCEVIDLATYRYDRGVERAQAHGHWAMSRAMARIGIAMLEGTDDPSDPVRDEARVALLEAAWALPAGPVRDWAVSIVNYDSRDDDGA